VTTLRDPLQDLFPRDPYLDDGGFTERVLAALPPRRRDRRMWVLSGSALVAAAIGVAILPELSGAILAARDALLGWSTGHALGPALLLTGSTTLEGIALGGLALAVSRD
jgi:hypothetical protein